jgi:uncharacterized spore protein YtfJ
MTEQNLPQSNEPSIDSVESDMGLAAVQDTMGYFLDAARVEAVYGEPIRNGDTWVIPTAEVVSIAGFGMGSGGGQADEAIAGGGGGGGGSVFSRPVAVIVVSPEGVQVKPVIDMTKIGLAMLTTAGFMALTAYRILTSGRRHR